MKKIEAICGYVVMDDNNNIIGYEAAYSGDGMVFKDKNKGNNVVYIPEHADWNGDWFISVDDLKANIDSYTFQDLVETALDFFEDYNLNLKQGKFIAQNILDNADWMNPETYLLEMDIDDIILSDDNGIFTSEQKRLAIENM